MPVIWLLFSDLETETETERDRERQRQRDRERQRETDRESNKINFEKFLESVCGRAHFM